jgi:hypothetical protein
MTRVDGKGTEDREQQTQNTKSSSYTNFVRREKPLLILLLLK